MLHLRIVAPHESAEKALEVFREHPSVCNVVHLPGAARRPEGDVLLADVAREDASVLIADLRELEIPEQGSLSIEEVDTQLSEAADRAEKAAPGAPSDAVVWEEIEARTSENAELSASFVAFMVLAMLIAAVGIFLDTPVLIVGAMVVGPEFGPIAGFCVAIVQRRSRLAARSFLALMVGFPVGIVLTLLTSLVFKWTGVIAAEFSQSDHELSQIISEPGFLSFFVAFCAGVAGVLSLTAAKSGALIGVLISVTTIPAAANIGVAAAYADWSTWRGSVAQLGINLAALTLAGVVTLGVQRLLYRRRRAAYLRDPARKVAGLAARPRPPVGGR